MIIKSPRILVEQGADEIFGLICYLVKALVIELPLGSCDQGQGLCITVPLERRLSTQSETHKKTEALEV